MNSGDLVMTGRPHCVFEQNIQLRFLEQHGKAALQQTQQICFVTVQRIRFDFFVVRLQLISELSKKAGRE